MDPNKIRLSNRLLTTAKLLDLISPRLLGSIENQAMTALIELMLVNGPMPTIVGRMDATGKITELGSGKAFVSALAAFKDGAPLGETSWIAEWTGKSLQDLPAWLQRRFLQKEHAVSIIEPGTNDAAAESILAALACG